MPTMLRTHHHRKFTRGLLCMGAAAAALLSAGTTVVRAADSQSGQIETVVVTAEKRSEDIQNVPMAVTAISGARLEDLGITDIQSVAPLFPNFGVIPALNNRNTAVQIRNFASGGTNPGIEGDVGVYIDGLYQPAGGGTSLASLVDISDVEVLAGPQGTLYGRNTVAGALVVTTRAPTQNTEAMVDITAGTYGYERFQAMYGGGIADNLAGRIVVFGDSGNDWMHDITTGQDVGGQQEFGGRARFLFTPTENLSINVIASYTRINSTCCDLEIAQSSLTGPYTTLTPNFLSSQAALGTPFKAPNYDAREVLTLLTPSNLTQIGEAEVSIDYTLPFGATLTSISGHNVYQGDINVQPVGDFASDEGVQTQHLNMTSESEELRLSSATGGFLEYLVGLYGYYQDTSYINYATLGPGANLLNAKGALVYPSGLGSGQTSGQLTDSGAAFAQVKVSPFDNFHIIGGIRYSYTDKEARQLGYTINTTPANTDTGKMTYSKGVATWLGTAQYNITDNAMAYVSASTGFKDGGFNLAKAVAGRATFNPETSFNYELGAKTSWFDHRLVLNGDIFQEKIYGYQQSVFDGTHIPVGFIVGNAGNLRSKGYEVSLQAAPIEPLSITGSISLTDEKVYGYYAGACSTYPGGLITPKNTGPVGSQFPAGTCNYSGLAPAYAPKMRWNIQLDWHAPLKIVPGWTYFAEADFNWIGSQYLDPTLDIPSYQGPIKLLNSRIGVQSGSGNWRFMAWGKNLTNQLYYSTYVALVTGAYMQGATPTTSATGYSTLYAPPRSYGVEATYRF